MFLKSILKIKNDIISFFSNNKSTKIVAFIVTIILWLIVVNSKKIEILTDIPIKYLTSNETVIANEVPKFVQIRFIGPRSMLRELKTKFFVSIDLRDKKLGFNVFRLKNEIVNVPLGIKVTDVYPELLSIKLDAIVKKNVEIKPFLINSLPFGYRLIDVILNPSFVEVVGAQSELIELSTLYTNPIDLSEFTESKSFKLGLDNNHTKKLLSVSKSDLMVNVNIESIIEQKKFDNVSVVANGSDKYKLEPDSVSVIIQGPKLILDKLNFEDIYVSVDVSFNAKGTYKEELIVSVPYKELEVFSITPSSISVWVY